MNVQDSEIKNLMQSYQHICVYGIPQVVNEILVVGGVEVLWLQLGISHPEAESRAEDAGIRVVSNRCLVIEHRKT